MPPRPLHFNKAKKLNQSVRTEQQNYFNIDGIPNCLVLFYSNLPVTKLQQKTFLKMANLIRASHIISEENKIFFSYYYSSQHTHAELKKSSFQLWRDGKIGYALKQNAIA